LYDVYIRQGPLRQPDYRTASGRLCRTQPAPAVVSISMHVGLLGSQFRFIYVFLSAVCLNTCARLFFKFADMYFIADFRPGLYGDFTAVCLYRYTAEKIQVEKILAQKDCPSLQL